MVLHTQIFFSGSRKVVDQKKRWVYTINPHFFRLEKSGSANSDFFSGLRKMVDQKKNLSLKNHFSTLFQKKMQIKWLIGVTVQKNTECTRQTNHCRYFHFFSCFRLQKKIQCTQQKYYCLISVLCLIQCLFNFIEFSRVRLFFYCMHQTDKSL